MIPSETSRQRPGVTTAMCAAMQAVGGGLGWSLLPPLMPRIAADLGISHTMGGVVWGAAPLGIALAAPLGGAMVDRHGPRKVAGLAMVAGAAACALRAAVWDGWSMATAMFLFGLHIGFVAPALPKMLAGHVPLAKLGRANGLAVLAYTLGTAITVLTARTVLAPLFGGWRPLMVAAAVSMALTGLLWLAVVRDRQLTMPHAGLAQVFALAKNTQMLRVAAMHFLLFGGYLALLGLLPRALTDGGLPPAKVGLAVASWLAAAGAANFLGPTLSDRLGLRRPFFLIGGIVAGSALLALAVLPPSMGLPMLVIAALGGGSIAPLLLSMPLELPSIGPTRAGGALGLLMLIGQVGGFLLPVASGWALQHGGFAAAMGLLGLAHLVIVLPAMGLIDTGRNAVAPATAPTMPALGS